MAKKIKIRVPLVLELDPEAWATEWGGPRTPGPSQDAWVRENVREYFLYQLAQNSQALQDADGTASLNRVR